MRMGPSLPKKGKPKPASQRKLTSAGENSSSATRSSLAINNHSPPAASSTNPPNAAAKENTPHTPPETHGNSSPVMIPEDARSLSVMESVGASSIDGWNHKRYQREDEELWGHEFSRTGHKLMDAIVKAGSSAGKLLESTLGKDRPITDEERANFYSAPIHPPVNEYHPPVVSSKPAHKDALRWMLQPPPPAKVMEGKVPVTRSASLASTVSRRTAPNSDLSLGRVMSERLVEAKRRKGEVPPVPVDGDKLSVALAPGRPTSRKTTQSTRSRSTRSRGQRSNRSATQSTTDSEEESSEGALQLRRRRSARPPVTPEVESDEGDIDEDEMPVPKPPPVPEVRSAQRPKLETILSSDGTGRSLTTRRSRAGGKENVPVPRTPDQSSSRSGQARSDATPVKERPSGASIDSGLALST